MSAFQRNTRLLQPEGWISKASTFLSWRWPEHDLCAILQHLPGDNNVLSPPGMQLRQGVLGPASQCRHVTLMLSQ